MNTMKRHLVLTGLILNLCALACAQDVAGDRVVVPARNTSHPRVVKANISNGSITVKTHAGQDVIVETGLHGRPLPERTVDGLRRLNIPPRGLEVEEDDNVITVRLSGEAHNSGVTLTVPVDTSLQLLSSNGGINVDGVHGEIDVTSHNGAITATNVSGTVVADTHNGELKVTFDRVDLNKPIAFTSYNGPIDVTLPADFKANLKLRASQGEIYTDFDVKLMPGESITEPNHSPDGRFRVRTSRVINGTINGGGTDATFTTYNGKILIRKK
jgi:DUF4097 and DUF4098 domain-containing protein YvlB